MCKLLLKFSFHFKTEIFILMLSALAGSYLVQSSDCLGAEDKDPSAAPSPKAWGWGKTSEHAAEPSAPKTPLHRTCLPKQRPFTERGHLPRVTEGSAWDTASVSTGCRHRAVSPRGTGVSQRCLSLSHGTVAWPKRGDGRAVRVAGDARQAGTGVVVGQWVPCPCSHPHPQPSAMPGLCVMQGGSQQWGGTSARSRAGIQHFSVGKSQ